jgi:DNA integrity scanning protein DisA with diadenylate cyclase activity
MIQKKQNRETLTLIEEATHITEKLKIKKILVVCESLAVWKAVLPVYAKNQFIIVIPSKRLAENITVETFICDFNGVARSDRLQYVLRSVIESGKVKQDERILCVYSLSGRRLLDTIRIVWIERFYGPITHHDLKRIGKTIPVELLLQLVNLAIEIAQEGREGAPVGTLFVVGDTEKVLELSKPMIFNPFRGYPEDERNIADQKVQESVKELSRIDGAFIVKDNGAVHAAGMYLFPDADKITPIKGLGARHAAASAISENTNAIAVAVSESTGTVRVFSGGKSVKTIRTYRPRTKRNT